MLDEEDVEMTDAETLECIEKTLKQNGSVSGDTVKRWMCNSSLEVLGAVHELVTYSPYWERIDPPLSEADLLPFLLSFYKRCLYEDPKGDWSLSRYEAAAAIVSRFQALLPNKKPERQALLVKLKDLLVQCYLSDNPELQTAIVTGALEHILEEPRFRSFFTDWTKHPLLRRAYDLAMEWAIYHER
ncbi:MAG: hypothetical protein ABFD46_01455 [Armatimonadota bacterium]